MCVCTCAYICACVCLHLCVRSCIMNERAHACLRASFMHLCMYMCLCARAFVRWRACVRVRVRMYVCKCVQTSTRACAHACIHVPLHAQLGVPRRALPRHFWPAASSLFSSPAHVHVRAHLRHCLHASRMVILCVFSSVHTRGRVLALSNQVRRHAGSVKVCLELLLQGYCSTLGRYCLLHILLL